MKGLSKDALVMIDVSAVATAIGSPKSFAPDLGANMVDMTPMDADWEEVLPDIKKWSMTVEAFYDPADDVQDAIEDAYFNSTSVEVTFRPQGTGTGKKEYTGTAYIENWKPAGAKSDSVGISIDLRGSGALVPALQGA